MTIYKTQSNKTKQTKQRKQQTKQRKQQTKQSNKTKQSKYNYKSIKHTKLNHTSNNYSREICSSASKYIKFNLNSKLFNQYKLYISNITKQFIKSHSQILNDIFANIKNLNKNKIKNKNIYSIQIKYTPLDKNNEIPPFIEIFRYLINNNDFMNNFTLLDQQNLKKNLELKHTKEFCYNFLDTSKLGNKILKLYNSISSNIKNDLIIKYPSLEFHSLLINNFTSFEIIKDIDLRVKNLVILDVNFKGRKLDNLIYIYMYNDEILYKDENKINLEQLSNEIVKRILFFNNFLNIEKIPNKLTLFLTDNLKVIDNDTINHMHFKTININSAVTNSYEIIIYRKQELLKSIFHELIHLHNLDFRIIPPELIQYIVKTHNIKSDNEYLLYECVTEILANLLNNLFLSKNSIEFGLNLQNEILFSTLQVVKILIVCNYNNWDEFAKVDNTHTHNHKKQFKQDSCVMSYYILKFYILMNLDTYFKNCLDTKLKFIQTPVHFNNLIKIFDSARNNILIKNVMDNLLKEINNKNKLKLENTLRMTCLESDLFRK